MKTYTHHLKPLEILFKHGDPSDDLYVLISGELYVCLIKDNQVNLVAQIEPGEYIGELAFFDHQDRSSTVIAWSECHLEKITHNDLSKFLPYWLYQVAKSMTKKIRLVDEILTEKGVKRAKKEGLRVLTIPEQKMILDILQKAPQD